MGVNIGGEVERVNAKDLSYADFVERYLKRNQPVLLTGLMDRWRACSDWVTDDGRPNLHFISNHFGKSIVQVADCSRREFTDQKRVEMSVAEFIGHWIDGISDVNSSCESNCSADARPLLYLKDWHFVKEYPQYVAYTTPPFFTDDWLNLYLDNYFMHGNPDILPDKNEINCSDYRFVYMGAKGTWTPLHADVFRSYSWSANVCGKKLWYFLPPSQCHLLFDRYLKTSVYDISDDVSEKQFPGFKKTVWLECTQAKNEIIFVPSGWYHQVYNMEDTISINHNWFNGYNLSWVWNLLMRDYNEARGYIEDIREISDDFEGLCQRNLAANTGMNFFDFLIFITRFSLANLVSIYHNEKDEGSVSKKLHHLIHNIISIQHVSSKMKSAEAFSIENLRRFSKEGTASSDINKIMEESRFPELCMAVNRTYGMLEELQQITSKTNSILTCAKFSLLLNHLLAGFEKLYVERDSGFKAFSPEDLVRIIDSAIADLSSLYGSCILSLSLELLDHESSTVL